MQRHFSQKLCVILRGQFLSATGTKDCLMMPAVAANMHTHIFDNAENRDFHLLKHDDAFFSVDQRNILRRGHNNRPRNGNVLRQRQLNVPGARWHIQHQIIEIRPQSFLQHLQQRFAGHRAAPHHRVIISDEIADRIGRQSVSNDRRHVGAIR
ncbi:hypothetical protein D3C78_1520600 [compost metagenome]